MTTIFNMPRLGMDMEEGTIIEWVKKEGDSVKNGETLLVIESDKANMEIECPEDGVLLKIFEPIDSVVKCGEPVAAIGKAGDTIPDLLARNPSVSISALSTRNKTEPSRTTQNDTSPENRVFISPLAKKLALKNKLDYKNLTGSGPDGRIVERDINKALENTARSAHSTTVEKGRLVPMVGIRKTTAQRMRQSLDTAAQAYHCMDVDVGLLLELREKINNEYSELGVKLSFNDFFIKITAKALEEFKIMNASETKEGIQLHDSVNIGMAVATEKGLMVPVVENAASKNLIAIAEETKELVRKAKQGKLSDSEMKGGTFTISNLGMFEVDSFTAIINPPEAGILAIGRIRKKIVVLENDEIVIRPTISLTLTYDHRIVDGAPAAQFLARIKLYLENPCLLIL